MWVPVWQTHFLCSMLDLPCSLWSRAANMVLRCNSVQTHHRESQRDELTEDDLNKVCRRGA